MLIRCERCSTVYELDETLLAPEGAPVQCTRCDAVFVAYPPRAPGRTLVGMPAVDAPPPAPPQPVSSAPSSQAAQPRAVTGPRRPDSGKTPRDMRPQVFRPGPSSTPSRPAPVLRKDQVGTFESRLKWSARWKWLGPLLVVSMVAVLGGAWLVLSIKADPEAARLRGEGRVSLALDDAASVEAAAKEFDEALRRDPSLTGAACDGALARLVEAELLREEWEDSRPRNAAGEVERKEDSRDPRLARGVALAAAAKVALDGVGLEATDPASARALAFFYAHSRDRAHLAKVLSSARGNGESDPWFDLAQATVDLDGGVEVRGQVVARLTKIAEAHPQLLHARWLLARGQSSLGRRVDALAVLDGLIAANARHEGARRLRASLSVPPPVPQAVKATDTDENAVTVPEETAPKEVEPAEAIAPATPEAVPSPHTDLSPLSDPAESERTHRKPTAEPVRETDTNREPAGSPASPSFPSRKDLVH